MEDIAHATKKTWPESLKPPELISSFRNFR